MYKLCSLSIYTCRSSFQWKWYKSRVVLRAVLKSKAFDFFDLSVHAVNLVFLMSLHFPPLDPRYDCGLRKHVIQM